MRRVWWCSAHLHVSDDLLPDVLKLFLMALSDELDLVLQFLTTSKLLVYKLLHFTPVSNTACFSFAFICSRIL
jgi:hypothetical protein